MRIDILTLFPEAFDSPLKCSILAKARERGRVAINVVDIRDFATDKHRVADDAPYGGGPGMVLKPEPIFLAVESLNDVNSLENVILLSPQGRVFDQQIARELAQKDDILLICGRYEGVDERVRSALVTDEFSIGDYVLSGGEIPALVVIDAVARLLPGVVGDPDSIVSGSFHDGLLGFPQYTRPRSFRGMSVPEVLLSGNHKTIERWRVKEAFKRTLQRRPELARRVHLRDGELPLLEQAKAELEQDRTQHPLGTAPPKERNAIS
jgi:tRNA (guanine37-N1)-methyltransferase